MSEQIFGGGLRNLSRIDTGGAVYLAGLTPNGQHVLMIVYFNSGETQLRVSDGADAPAYRVLLPLVER